MTPYWQWPIEKLAPEIEKGVLSPLDLVMSFRERIETYDAGYGSFVALNDSLESAAISANSEIQNGRYRGPLHGIPVAVKDNYLTLDLPTFAGSGAPDMNFVRRDAAAVAGLKAAGAIIVGKTAMHEFAWGTVTPGTKNPWNTAYVPGGSSGGSGCAVAAGFCPAALGSDTGGSIRIPASACGTVGLKPSFGRISRDGIVPHSWSLDHAGPLCRSVTDAAILLQILAGADSADPGTCQRPIPDYRLALNQSVKGLRIGVCRRHFFEKLQPAVAIAVEQAMDVYRNLGATIVEFDVPFLEYGLGAIFAIELASSSTYHGQRLNKQQTHELKDDVRALVEMGIFVSATDYLKAEQLRRRLIEDFDNAFNEFDVVLSPTMPLTAWETDCKNVTVNGESESVLAASWRLTYPWNLTGMPAISIPCGFDAQGLPIGLQIAGRLFDEASVFRVAHAYEREHDWNTRFPDLEVDTG